MKNPFSGQVIRQAWDEEELANQGRVDPTVVIERAMAMVPDTDIDAFREASVRAAFDAEDDRRRRLASDTQLDLFSGDLRALEGAIPTADGGRVKLGKALMADWLIWINISQEQTDRMNKKHSDRIGTFTRLAPLLNESGTTTEQAIDRLRSLTRRP